MTEWIIVVNNGQEILDADDGLYDVIVSDTFNPFGNFAKAYFDDVGGELFDIFRRGVKVEFRYLNDNTNDNFEQRFVGFVVNDLAQEADGAEQIEIEAYSFDQFLRGSEVSSDQSGNTIGEALETVIKDDVPPISWDAAQVDVVDNAELTQSYQGVTVEEFLLSVREKSAGEVFGVDNSLNFFFRIPESSRTRRDIDNSQWVTHDIGEQSGETKNKVTVYYGSSGNQAVTVDRASDQLRVGDNLNTAGPAQQGNSITRSDIETAADAIDAGEAYLNSRAATLTGPVTTFGLNDAQPGETVGLTIEPRGIDADFRIAENRMQWRGETNELTLVKKKGADADILIEQSKKVDKLDRNERDPSVVPDKITDAETECQIKVTGEANGVPFDTTRITNTGRDNLVRTWTEPGSQFTLQELVLSTTDRRPSRSDSDFPSTITTTSFSTTQPTITTVEFSASVTANQVRSIGLANNDLHIIGRLEEPVDDPTITITVEIDTKPDESKSVVTTNGQAVIADIIDPTESVTQTILNYYEYGSDTSDTSESDTSLTTTTQAPIADKLVYSEDGISFLFDIITENINDTDPIYVTNTGSLALAQSTFGFEVEDDFPGANFTSVSDVSYSGGEAVKGSDEGAEIAFDLNTNYRIPEDNLVAGARLTKTQDTGDPVGYELRVDYTDPVLKNGSTAPLTPGELDWEIDSHDQYTNGTDLDGGHQLILEITDSGADAPIFDYVFIADDRYLDTATLDNTVHQDNGYLDDPQLYPDTFSVSFEKMDFESSIRDITIDQTWTDTTEDQSITVTPPGSTFNNTSTVNIGTASVDQTKTLQIDAVLSNYPSSSNPQSATPRYGYAGQEISAMDINAEVVAAKQTGIGEVTIRVKIPEDSNTNDTFAEAGQLYQTGTGGTSLITRVRLPEFVKQSGQAVISNERLKFVNHPDN